MKKSKLIPAIPPADYKGSQASWMIALQERGLWDGQGWHGDVMIKEVDWWEILEQCEEGNGPSVIEFINNVKTNKMSKYYSCSLRGVFLVIIVTAISSLITGTLIWMAYPRIVSLFPKLISSGYLLPEIAWTNAIIIMVLIEAIASIGAIRNLMGFYRDDEEETD